MSKKPRIGKRTGLTKKAGVPSADFDEILRLIDAARSRAVAGVNTALIELYWTIGENISRKVADDGWGKGTVEALADHIQRRQPNARGFSASNLWRMMQFFETYRDESKLATLLRELPWSHNLSIMSRCKRDEEREFYLEALDRNVKKPHERPSIGVLLCATKDHEFVKYALSRSFHRHRVGGEPEGCWRRA